VNKIRLHFHKRHPSTLTLKWFALNISGCLWVNKHWPPTMLSLKIDPRWWRGPTRRQRRDMHDLNQFRIYFRRMGALHYGSGCLSTDTYVCDKPTLAILTAKGPAQRKAAVVIRVVRLEDDQKDRTGWSNRRRGNGAELAEQRWVGAGAVV